MFGTVGRLKVKPGKLDELIKTMNEDQREVDGSLGYYVYKVEGKENELILAVAFRDKESYFKTADDPAQDESYRKMVALLDGPPSWEDGEIIVQGK
ncbi:MAG: putative quinol monooxygenase [Actinomycetota bacterium]